MALPSQTQSSISSSSSSFSYGFTYDVFLSFRGSDTRYGFTGNLYKALDDKGIHTFIDNRELQGGAEITPTLLKAIEESRIFIPVLSLNYASSSFCLDELVHIIHGFKESGRLVLPIFYDVEPSHVRHHKGSYGKALDDHIERFLKNKDSMERLQKWKMALTQTANFSGHHFNPRNGYEHEFIEKIVKYVSNKINHVPLYVADYPVGIESRVLKVNSLMDFGSNGEVQMLGIYGPGGMGKTTLARAVYNSIADQFDDLCFLHNVRENSAKYGLEHLQGKLLSKLVELDIKLGDVNEGIPIIKQRLHRKKVLLILDDVHEMKQLQVLAGGLDWFGPGSRVIITTRDKQLLASLRVLEWHKYPSRVIPSDFSPKKLSICKLTESDLQSFELRGTMKRFVNMRELNLDKCQYLTQIHDVSSLPNLEIFSFQYCKNLIEIHKSVGFLNKLEILKAGCCIKLMSFPPLKLTSLQELEL